MSIETLVLPPAHQESETLEFKREATLQALAPSVVAMLNHRGGAIFVGYSDTGELLGLTADVPILAQQLTRQLSEAVTPEEVFQITIQEEQGRSGLLLEVPQGVRKPYVYDGRIYVRTGAENRLATAAAISQMLREQESTEQRWESRPAIGVDATQLDRHEIASTTEAADKRYSRPSVSRGEALLTELERLDLARDGWPTQAAVVLFKTEQVRRYTQASVRAVVFADATLMRISDERLYSEGAFSLFERLYTFLQAHLPVASYLAPGSRQRLDTPAYPPEVLREAIVNALTHRDYQDQASIQVRLFPEHLEIWNPGILPEEYVENPSARTVSRPRNPDIARLFHLRGFAEMLGIGIWRIRQQMALARLPAPQWRNEAGGVLLTLPRHSHGRTAERIVAPGELLPRQAAFLAATRSGERFTRDMYQNRFAPDVSERSARNDLQALLEQGYLELTGRGYYRAYVRTDKPVGNLKR